MPQNFSIDDQLKKAKNFFKGHYQDAKICYETILLKYTKNIRAIEGLKKIYNKNTKIDNVLHSLVKKLIYLHNSSSFEECIIFGKELLLKYSKEALYGKLFIDKPRLSIIGVSLI